MRRLILLVALITTAAGVQARFARSPLSEVVKRTEAILDVRISSVRTEDWESADGSIATCGFVYEARVNQTLKGSAPASVTFASPKSFQVGGRYLLFLDAYSGDFPTDVHFRWPPEEEGRRLACLRSLPTLKASWLDWGWFLPNEFVELSYWLVPPDEAMPAEVSIETVRSRGEIVNFGDPTGPAPPPEVDALLYEHVLGTTVVSWPLLRRAIEDALAHDPNVGDALPTDR